MFLGHPFKRLDVVIVRGGMRKPYIGVGRCTIPHLFSSFRKEVIRFCQVVCTAGMGFPVDRDPSAKRCP